MSDEKFTPGPWECSVYSDPQTRANHRADIRGTDGKRVAFAYAEMRLMHRLESTANAHLIAAAPDLYEACKAMEAWFEELDESDRQNGDHGLMALRKEIHAGHRNKIILALQKAGGG